MDLMTANSGTTTSKYIRDYESLFVPIQKDQLQYKARSGLLRHSQFRSLCWRYFLNCLPECQDQWLDSCVKSRKQYEEVKAKHSPVKQQDDLDIRNNDALSSSAAITTFTVSTERPSEDAVNPLQEQSISDEIANSTNTMLQAERDKELEEEQLYIKAENQCDHKNVFKTIERDVVRTFPDMEFFRQTEMQGILENVLFNYASENPHLSYKQGMHELLATLLYVLHTDSQNCLINYEGGYANEAIASLLDLKYLEHDVFHLFCALMKSIETWYQNDEILMTPQETTSKYERQPGTGLNTNRSNPRTQVGSVLGNKLKMISETIVKYYDIELFNHLEALQIAPQIYGIRWMRLLFGREFEFLDLLTVWDAIICDQNFMSLTDYIFASMLLTIREELVNGDYTDCLNNLMRHQFKDVQYVIKLALYLRDPSNYNRPKSIHFATPRIHNQISHHSRHAPVTSLTSKLSQQYISSKHQPSNIVKNFPSTNPSSESIRRYSQKVMDASSLTDNRDSRKMFNMSTKPKTYDRRLDYLTNSNFGEDSSGIKFLNTTSRGFSSTTSSSSNKFLPNINKFVSSIGQNIQDKTNQQSSLSSNRLSQQRSSSSSHGTSTIVPRQQQQQYHQQSLEQLVLAPKAIKEYEMREMQSTSSSSGSKAKIRDGKISGSNTGSLASKNALNLSTESYEDLHSIVDYCWRLLSEQIDSLQRCLPKEKGLHSEDEIFVALAQLKKVRDVLKGSLRLEDELEMPQAMNRPENLVEK